MPSTDALPRHLVESWHLADSATAHRLNQLLADDLVQQAGANQRGAISEAFEFQQAEAAALNRLRDRGVLPQQGTVQSLESLLNDSYASRTARTTAERLQNQTINQNAPKTLPKPNAAAPARIRLPTSLPSGAQALAAGSLLLGRASQFSYGALGLGASDEAAGWIGGQLPSNIAPLYDGLNRGARFLREALPSGPTESAGRLFNQLGGGGLGDAPNFIPAAGLGRELFCNIFGVGCPTTTGGVPNLGGSSPAPPFYGGQTPGAMYRIELPYDYTLGASTGSSVATAFNVAGPILGAEWRPHSDPSISGYELFIRHGDPVRDAYVGGGSGPLGTFVDVQLGALRVARQDGQPDTGGNPAPLPGSANRPARPPALFNRPVTPPAGAPALPSSGVPSPATTPLTAPPAPPPQTAPPDPLAPLKKPDPLGSLLPLLGALPFLIPSFGKSPNASGAAQSGLNQPPVKTAPDTPTPTCRYDSSNIAGRVDLTNTTLQAVQLFMEQQMMSKLNTIDEKLGPQIPNGGLANFAKKTWNFLQVDRVLNFLSWITLLHNAYMLSNSLSQTLFSAIGNVLDAVGIEDADGSPINVGAAVGKWTDAFFKSLFGVETVDGIKETWKRYNRIYQAAANLLNSIQSMFYSMAEILEIISNYVGKIGNSLRRSGTVLQNSFNWMNPNANFSNNRFFQFLQNAQDVVESVDQIASSVVSIQEQGEQLFDQSQELNKAWAEQEAAVAKPEDEAAAAQVKPLVKITPAQEGPSEES